MIDGIYHPYATALFLLCVGYVVGYIVGRLDLLCRTVRPALSAAVSPAEKPKDFFSQQPSPAKGGNRVAIDDSTFVAPVRTDTLTKSDTISLGKTVTTADDIQASVSRLAQLKGE